MLEHMSELSQLGLDVGRLVVVTVYNQLQWSQHCNCLYHGRLVQELVYSRAVQSWTTLLWPRRKTRSPASRGTVTKWREFIAHSNTECPTWQPGGDVPFEIRADHIHILGDEELDWLPAASATPMTVDTGQSCRAARRASTVSQGTHT